MSRELSFYRPTTPPRVQYLELTGASHSRTTSESSAYSNNSSPWSVVTSATSSTGDSPPRQHHGPALLPKIRPQDVVIEPPPRGGPRRHRRVMSSTRDATGFMPYPPNRPSAQQNVILVSPAAASPMYGSHNGSALSSPVTITPSHKRRTTSGHSRSYSTSIIDETTLNRYAYPTYRQLPRYASQPQASPTVSITPVTPNVAVYASYPHQSPLDLSYSHIQSSTQAPLALSSSHYSYAQVSSGHPSPVGISNNADPQSTTLLSYLTSSTQTISLVRNVSVALTRGMHDYFWWDIRNLRSWTSFTLTTFNSIHGLTKLLKTAIPSELTPEVVVPRSLLAPESESVLVGLIQNIYAPRINAALAVSQGAEHLKLYMAPNFRPSNSKNYGGPHFLANYASDTERTSAGLPRGRLVGIVKSFDRWNSGMRNEAPHRRVEYLNGLAHLQKCMREHSCRYGFIITEIELVCVRAGCDEGDDVPYFGFLEVSAPIPTKSFASTVEGDRVPQSNFYSYPYSPSSSNDSSFTSQSPLSESSPFSASEDALNVPMTATLALYFLMMLSRSQPLPFQPSAHLNVGGPGALTRQRVLPEGKDKWIPEPQIGEKRDAKRVRGWVWPQDAWHRRESGGVPRPRANAAVEPTPKKWHK